MSASAGGVRMGGAYVEIFAKDGKFQQALTRVENRLKATAKTMRQMGTNLAIGGAALGTPFVIAAREAAAFTLSMAQVRANTKATDAQFASLNKAAREMGVAMGQSPTEVATAMSELAKAGLDAEGVMASIGPVLAVAAADNMELARAVEVVVGTMSQFGMSTSDFGQIADKLQAAANASVTSVDLIGESLSYVGPQAQAAGQSFDTVAAALGTLAQGGIRGSMAGTQLARVLEAMASNEGDLNALGVSVRDAAGNLRPFMDVLGDLGRATAGMNNADRLQKFMDIFDIRGARAAMTLSQLGDEYKRILGEIGNSSGAATDKAKQVLDSFGGSVKVLTASFADLKIALITSMGVTATNAVKGMTTVLSVITKLIETNPQLVATVAAVAGGLVALGMAGIAGSLAMTVMAKGLSLVRAILPSIPMLISPVGIAIATAAIGITTFIVAARQLSPAFKQETDAIMAAVLRMDFGAAWQVMNLNFAIALTQMAAKADEAMRQVQGFFAATGALIGDKLVEGLDRFMGLFGSDIVAIQTSLQKLGVYFRAAFDWKFAVAGMGEAIKQIDAEAEKAREKAPTADARAKNRTRARADGADRREADNEKAAKGWEDTIKTLRQDLDKARDRALGVKDKQAETDTRPAGAQMPEDRGVMPVGPLAGNGGKEGSGIGQTLGTFGSLMSSGDALGVGPELAKLEDPAKETARNTGAMVDSLNRIAPAAPQGGNQVNTTAGSPATATTDLMAQLDAIYAAGRDSSVSAEQLLTGGPQLTNPPNPQTQPIPSSAASALLPQVPQASQQATRGTQAAADTGNIGEIFTKGVVDIVAAITAHTAQTKAGNALLSKIVENTKTGMAFA